MKSKNKWKNVFQFVKFSFIICFSALAIALIIVIFSVLSGIPSPLKTFLALITFIGLGLSVKIASYYVRRHVFLVAIFWLLFQPSESWKEIEKARCRGSK